MVPAEHHEHWLPSFFSKREFARYDAIRISRWLFFFKWVGGLYGGSGGRDLEGVVKNE
ncbi:MAG: hypothetical protein PHF64_09295 [Methanoregula sp.]|nr:hypothetical protein [Methanoregula sp.]